MLAIPTPAAMPSHLSGRPAENSMITAIIRYWIAMPVSPDESTTAPIITSVCRPTETSPRHSVI